MANPRIIPGDIAIDDRGSVSFVNDFTFEGIKRFYSVENHVAGFVRAWHAHKNEAKYVLVTGGSAIVGVVEIDNWETPGKDVEVHRFVLSAGKPRVLYIPQGCANGFKSLTDDLKIMFFSTSTLDESKEDDYRFDADYWDIWTVEQR